MTRAVHQGGLHGASAAPGYEILAAPGDLLSIGDVEQDGDHGDSHIGVEDGSGVPR